MQSVNENRGGVERNGFIGDSSADSPLYWANQKEYLRKLRGIRNVCCARSVLPVLMS